MAVAVAGIGTTTEVGAGTEAISRTTTDTGQAHNMNVLTGNVETAESWTDLTAEGVITGTATTCPLVTLAISLPRARGSTR